MTLREAIEARDWLRLRQLLHDGADPQQTAGDGQTLLTWAIGGAGVPFIRALIDGGADPKLTNAAGEDALERAAKMRRKNVFKLIGRHFPSARVAEAEERLPFFRKPQSKPPAKRSDPLKEIQRALDRAQADPRIGHLVSAAAKGDVKTVQQLLEDGADPDARAPNPDVIESPVWAALFAKEADVVKLLADAGADLNAGWPDTPLCVAANWGNLDLVRSLIDGGADVNLPNSSHETPLLRTVLKGDAKVVAELVNMGAHPNLVPKKRNYDTVSNYSPLQYAAMGRNQAIIDLLVAAGGSGAQNLEAMLLCSAAGKGGLPAVKKKIEQQGVDVNAKDASHRTPLICAALAGRAKVVQYLLARGADLNLPSGAKSDGESPLIAAALSGKVNVVRMLVEAGADLDYAPGDDSPEGTALAYAKEGRLKKVVDYLLQVQRERGRHQTSQTPRGVPTFDTNDAAFLVAAPVESVAGSLAALLDASVWQKDMLGQKVKLTNRCYAVWRLAGQPWSAVMKLHCQDFKHWPRLSDAAAISRSLETRALFVANSDTGGVAQYALFDKGELVELFDYGTAPENATAKSVVKQFASCYQVDLSKCAGLKVGNNKVFASSVRTLDLAKVKNDLDFINDYVTEQDAFVPFFVDEWGRAGQRVELTLQGLGPDDIERLDYVAVG
jgi:ankyrin repeat protein